MDRDHLWLAIGFTGQALFTMRFLVQWLQSERLRRSVVPLAFWWFSLAGGFALLLYAIHRRDAVFVVGQATGLVIYARNLWMIHGVPDRPRGTGAATLRHPLALATLWWALLLVAAIAARPLMPPDETRYATVAWEMHLSGNWLSPTLNGAPYGHKPPLLFWLIDAGWRTFGVNEVWLRVLPGLAALAGLVLTWLIARRLAPQRADVATMALWVSASTLLWSGLTGAVMFDLLLACCVLFAIHGIARAADGAGVLAWLQVGLGLGVGVLAKGPVALLHVLPLALLAPWWCRTSPDGWPPRDRWCGWYARCACAVLLGVAIGLAWAIPSAHAGGDAFARELLWNQTADRIAGTQYHLRPLWFYLAALPVVLLPWLLRTRDAPRPTVRWRFIAAWLVPPAIAFSFFHGKQMHYLLPLVPAFAFIVAGTLAAVDRPPRRWETATLAATFALFACALLIAMRDPRAAHLVEPHEIPLVGWTVGTLLAAAALALCAASGSAVRTVAITGSAAVLAVIGLQIGVMRAAADAYELQPIATRLATLQQAGYQIAHAGKYRGEFQFVGRLREPLHEFRDAAELRAWVARQPRSMVLLHSDSPLTHREGRKAVFEQKLMGHFVALWPGAELAALSTEWADDGTDPDASTRQAAVVR